MKYLKKFENNNLFITKVNFHKLKDSVPITNNYDILDKIVKIQMKAFENNEKNLSKNLVDELTVIFGEENLSINYDTKIWILKYNDLIFNIFTAKIKGTSIEICDYNYDDIRIGKRKDDIIMFLEILYAMINSKEVKKQLKVKQTINKYNL